MSAPGRPPVEGYSNFLWVLVLVPVHLLGAFDPGRSFRRSSASRAWCGDSSPFEQVLVRATSQRAPGVLTAIWIACAPPIVIWTASGLENGLMLLLVVQLWATAVRRERRWRARCGLLVALAAMTHPEGLIYMAFALAACVADVDTVRPARVREMCAQVMRSIVPCVGMFLLLFAPFFAFRLITFGQSWPQTYYAKRAHASFGAVLAELAQRPGRCLAADRGGGAGAGRWGRTVDRGPASRRDRGPRLDRASSPSDRARGRVVGDCGCGVRADRQGLDG